MVGFGSSLRMGRRSGWEAAYMDYETLKLLLSQIESVYEEEGHRTSNSGDVFVGDNTDKQNGRNAKGRKDYRDELFLESDSDVAFASSQSFDNLGSDSSESKNVQVHSDPRTQANAQRFTLMGSSSSEDSGSADESGRCGGVPWRGKKSRSKKRRAKPKPRFQQDDDYYVPRDTPGPKGFIVDDESDTFNTFSTMEKQSLSDAPFQYNLERPNEHSGLLRHATPQKHAFFGSSDLIGDKTPPTQNFGTDPYASSRHVTSLKGLGASGVPQGQSPGASQARKKSLWEEERRRARKQRRRRLLARKKREREKKVPAHIRIAHSKSRAITERFLGLLRAEVEKVTLFTQARLGELADTAGSLRFLSSEELTEWTGSFMARAPSTAYDYPLSDGGIHPSASSSSDDGAGGPGVFPWSDSSSDEESSRDSNAFPTQQPFSSSTTPTKKMSQMGPFFGKTSRSKQELDQYEAAKRKIDHFQALRSERPIFQRNDHIVGEDLLLVSAVDEADAYSAVGVELLHILKYVCVNVIAVRKVCRKHDRLLQNRMLGGFYHRKRTTSAQEEATLGGLVAHIAGDIYEAHPALIGVANHGKLLGIYDLKIQQLANSRTVKVISSCLALALSEYEVSRTRADALATLNPMAKRPNQPTVAQKVEAPSPFVSFDFNATNWVSNTKEKLGSPCIEGEVESFTSDEGNGSGPPSTASSVSLARLRFTVLSIAAMREASRIKANPFATYLSRLTLSFTGSAVIGEGLDGCSRETLDFLVSYTPDAALLLDSSTLYEGLRRGQWRNMSIASVMKSSLAVALRDGKSLKDEEQIVTNAISILPKSNGLDTWGPAISMTNTGCADFPLALLRLNRYSLFLYTANYYVIHPTTNVFVGATGANDAYSAAIIGGSSLAAIVAAILHCNALSGHSTSRIEDRYVAPYKGILTFSASAAILGNLVHIHAMDRMSIPMAVLGRVILGLASADVVHRQLAIVFLDPSHLVSETACLVQIQVLGLIFGLLVGTLVEWAPFRPPSLDVKSLMVSDWVMIALWFFQLVRLTFTVNPVRITADDVYQSKESVNIKKTDYEDPAGNSSDSSSSEPAPGVPVRLFHQTPEMRGLEESVKDGTATPPSVTANNTRRTDVTRHRKSRKRGLKALMKRLSKVMSFNIAVPLTLGLVVYTMFAQEILFSSCALITSRYFTWRGSVAGLLLGALSATILPVDFVSEQVARRYEERATIKRSIQMLIIGLLIMVNWGSVFAMAANIKVLFTETRDMRHHLYDWLLGIPQYLVGFLLTFTSLKALEGSSRSLLSKVSPPNSKHHMTNIGTIATFLGLFAKFLANMQIVAVGLSHRVINTDIVNCIVVTLLVGCIVAHYFVRKHYFFMM